MMTYVTAFIFYTLAMIGILLVGFIVYKKTFDNSRGDNRGLIKVIDSTPIGNKKLLLVVKVKDEYFLVASGIEHTTFLSKLSLETTKENKQYQKEEIKQQIQNDNYYMTNEKPYRVIPEERYNDIRRAISQDDFQAENERNFKNVQNFQNNQYLEQQNQNMSTQYYQPLKQAVGEEYIEYGREKAQPVYENHEQNEVQHLQKQFRDLYEQEEQLQAQIYDEATSRKASARQLFRTMKANSKNGSRN